jgi:hypothetical protein
MNSEKMHMNHLLKLAVKFQVLKARKGQGVIEYAGALVIATAIVAAVLTVAPGALGTLFTTIINHAVTLLTPAVPAG